MASTKEITCKCGCKRKKMVRTADLKRGWGLFYDKSCKARYQSRTGGSEKYYAMIDADGGNDNFITVDNPPDNRDIGFLPYEDAYYE